MIKQNQIDTEAYNKVPQFLSPIFPFPHPFPRGNNFRWFVFSSAVVTCVRSAHNMCRAWGKVTFGGAHTI